MAERRAGGSAYRRIVLKLSGEAFRNRKTGAGLDPEVFDGAARQIRQVQAMNLEIGIVIGGGNIFRGLPGQSGGIARAAGDAMGMLATVVNALALQSALERIGAAACVMTALAIPAIAEPFVLRRALAHLQKGRILIFGGGTGNPYFTTDSAAALRACELQADVLLKATHVDGVFDADPREHPDARRFERLDYGEALARRLKVMDAAAFSLCMENRIPIVVFDFFQPGALERAARGEPIGTRVGEETGSRAAGRPPFPGGPAWTR